MRHILGMSANIPGPPRHLRMPGWMLRGPNGSRVLRIPSRTQSVTIVMPPEPLEDSLPRRLAP
jgi:hypothetical protein